MCSEFEHNSLLFIPKRNMLGASGDLRLKFYTQLAECELDGFFLLASDDDLQLFIQVLS